MTVFYPMTLSSALTTQVLCSPNFCLQSFNLKFTYSTSLSSGNFGESFKRRYLKSDPSSRSISLVEAEGKAVYNAEEHTLTYDPAAGQAILELYMEFMPAQGKNDSYSGYYNILTGEICQTLRG